MPKWNYSMRKAVNKYAKENLVRYSFELNKKHDMPLITYLNNQPNKNDYIRRMLYQAMMDRKT